MRMRFHDKTETDLFEHAQASDKKIRKKTRFLLPSLKNTITISYENFIFIAIGFVMSCIIFFSLGVEKGRQDVNHKEKPKKVETKVSVKKEIIIPEKIIFEKKETTGDYIIQLAAFKKRESAKEEVDRLKKNGYKPGIRKSGSYYQLYIGGFNKRQAAEDLLGKLKGKYKDSYIKKI